MARRHGRAAVNPDQAPAAPRRRRRRWLVVAVAVLALLVGGRWLALETAERAWAATITGGDAYLAGHNLARLMRIVVLVISVGWGTLHLWFIYRSIGSVQMPRRIGNLEIVEAVPQRILLAGTLLAGLAFGIGLAWGSGDWWMQALIASGAPQYGVVDPILRRDVGYYLAELPWAETRQAYALLATLTAVVVVGLLYVGIGSLRFRGLRPQASPRARGHLALLLGCLALVVAWGALLDPAEVVAGHHGPVVHPVIDVRIPGAGVLAVLAIATAVVSVAWAWWDHPEAVSAAWAVLLAGLVIVYGLVPGLARGSPRSGRAADTTFAADRHALERLAFGAEGLTVRPTDSAPPLARGPAGFPVWDPTRVARVAARSGRLQRGTTVAGVALAPELAGGGPAWLVATAPDDTALARADPPPDWTAVHRGASTRAGPPLAAVETDSGLALRDVPFGTGGTWFGPGFNQYAVLPGTDSGGGGPLGIPIDGAWQRVALAWALQSPELLRRESRGGVLLWRRGATERLARLAPFAAFDEAAPVLTGGALWWVAYGYLDAEYFPLAEPLRLGDRVVRYRRAGFLGAVNAVTGDTRLWLAPGHDSLAAAWGRAFRGLVAPSESIPPVLRRQLPYPGDALRLAAAMFAREQDTLEWQPLPRGPYTLLAAGAAGEDAVWLATAFSQGSPARLQAIVAAAMGDSGQRLFAWRQALPDRLPPLLVGSSETAPGVARAWLADGRVLIVQARFAEPESGAGQQEAVPRIESVFISWGDRHGEGASVAIAGRDLLASGPLGAAADTSLAGRWRAARGIAAEMDAALTRRNLEEFGRLYRRLLEALGVPHSTLAPRP